MNPEPTRARLEQLMARLATAYVGALGPMERALVSGLIRSRGWDLHHLASGNGPLAPLSEGTLTVLVMAFADELAGVVDPGMVTPYDYTERELDAAMQQLKEALG